MNESEIPKETRAAAPTEDVASAVESLRTMFHFAALCGIVLGVTLYVYIHKQVAWMKRQNQELVTFIEDYNSNVVTKVDMTRTNLEAFARTDPSIRPLLLKYFGNSNNAAPRP